MRKILFGSSSFFIVLAMVCSLFSSGEVYAKKTSYTVVEKNFGNGLSLVKNDKELYGLIDKKGKLVVKMEYAKISTGYLEHFLTGEEKKLPKGAKASAYIVEKEVKDSKSGKFTRVSGLINPKGKVVLPLKDYGIYRINYEGEPRHRFNIPFLSRKGKVLYDKYKKELPEFGLEYKGKVGTVKANGKVLLPLSRFSGQGQMVIDADNTILTGFGEKTGPLYVVFTVTGLDLDLAHFFDDEEGKKAKKRVDKAKWGVVSARNGKKLLKPIYDDIKTIDPTFVQSFFAKKGQKWGILSETGKILQDFIYDDVMVIHPENDENKVGRGFVKKGEKWAEASLSGKVGEFNFDNLYSNLLFDFGDGYYWGRAENYHHGITVNGKTAVFDEAGKKLFEAEGERILELGENTVSLIRNGKAGLIDKDNKTLIPFSYVHVTVSGIFDKRLKSAFVYKTLDKREHKVTDLGYVAYGGKELVKPEYNSISFLKEGLYAVKKEGKTGFIDEEGKTVLPFVYDDHAEFRSWKEGEDRVGFFLVKKGSEEKGYKLGLVDMEGKEALPLEYDSIGEFEDGYAEIVRGSNYKYGVINQKAEVVLPAEYDYIYPLEKGFRKIEKENKYGIADKNYKIILPVEYNAIHDIENGVRYVKKDEKFGIVDENYNIVMPAEYDEIGDVHEGFRLVNKDGRYGYANENFEIVIPIQFFGAENFYNGSAIVETEDHVWRMDKKGRLTLIE